MDVVGKSEEETCLLDLSVSWDEIKMLLRKHKGRYGLHAYRSIVSQ